MNATEDGFCDRPDHPKCCAPPLTDSNTEWRRQMESYGFVSVAEVLARISKERQWAALDLHRRLIYESNGGYISVRAISEAVDEMFPSAGEKITQQIAERAKYECCAKIAETQPHVMGCHCGPLEGDPPYFDEDQRCVTFRQGFYGKRAVAGSPK